MLNCSYSVFVSENDRIYTFMSVAAKQKVNESSNNNSLKAHKNK